MPALKSPGAPYLCEAEVQVPNMTTKALLDLGPEKSDFIPSTLLALIVPAIPIFSLFPPRANLCGPESLQLYHRLCPW